ncbi:MAG TPA: chloride channel protein [Thermomicrobiales bacterium]|nr:chloride channel protein [Thermomicrobiales bacterium]
MAAEGRRAPGGRPAVERLAARVLRGRRWAAGGAGFESSRFLAKWVGLAILIGIVAGVGAILFYLAIRFVTHATLGPITGFLPPEPRGEGNGGVRAAVHPWLIPVVTTLGGLVSGLIVFTLAPEAEGHGTDSAIAAFHYKAGQIRARIPPIKLVASAITIGTGGSGGREGPTAQISAGFGSLLANLLNLSASDRRICVAVGIGSGIGAIFRAPLGGAMLAAEILYVNDLEAEAILPALIASIVGYSIFGAVVGWEPIFGTQSQFGFDKPIQLVYFAALGLLCGAVGLAYARGFYGITGIFRRLRIPQILKPALGGLLVGLFALKVPQILGTGYGWVQFGMDQRLLTIPLWIVLLLPFAKIVATGLSIGSGGSGGIFGPGMVIGGMLGAAFWRLFAGVLPGMPPTPATFTIVAMMALFGGIAHAPLAVMLMVAEMTGNLSLLAPAMLAVGLATLVVGNNTIYESQLPSRVDSPAHRYKYAFPLLATLRVRDAARPADVVLRPDDRLHDAEARLHAAGVTGAPVVGEAGTVVGMLTAEDIAREPEAKRETATVGAAMGPAAGGLAPDVGLDTALDTMTSDGLAWAPVLDAEQGGRLAGVVTVGGILRAYREALHRSVRRTDSIALGSTLLEVTVTPDSPLATRAVRDLALPAETLLVACRRGAVVTFPHGDTVFQPGDVVTVVTSVPQEERVRRYLEAGGRHLAER